MKVVSKPNDNDRKEKSPALEAKWPRRERSSGKQEARVYEPKDKLTREKLSEREKEKIAPTKFDRTQQTERPGQKPKEEKNTSSGKYNRRSYRNKTSVRATTTESAATTPKANLRRNKKPELPQHNRKQY